MNKINPYLGKFQNNAPVKFLKLKTPTALTDPNPGEKSFVQHMKEGIEAVNKTQIESDKMAVDLSTGNKQNIHEAMLASSHAELKFNLMVKLRNKVLDAYQEVMRMQV